MGPGFGTRAGPFPGESPEHIMVSAGWMELLYERPLKSPLMKSIPVPFGVDLKLMFTCQSSRKANGHSSSGCIRSRTALVIHDRLKLLSKS